MVNGWFMDVFGWRVSERIYALLECYYYLPHDYAEYSQFPQQGGDSPGIQKLTLISDLPVGKLQSDLYTLLGSLSAIGAHPNGLWEKGLC